MKFARFDVERPPGPDTVTLRARLKGAQGFAKEVELLVLSASAPREAVDRFLQGGARLAELADGNLLQVLEVGYEQNRAFLATEASDGEPLSRLLEKCRERGLDAMPTALAFGIGAELAKALAHAHAHTDVDARPDPVTHGALRAEAVTLSVDGAVKLGGFVPWRAAPSVHDDVEKLAELVSQWVAPSDKKLVRESAGGVTTAAELRKAWAAYQALNWPQLAPDARRTLVAFGRGEATKDSVESKLGQRPAPVSVPKWAFAVGGVAVALVAVALLWPDAPPAAPKLEPEFKVAAAPKTKKQAEPPFAQVLELDGAQYHLTLPDELPSLKFSGELWFKEETQPTATMPPLFVIGAGEGATQVGTVSTWWWHLSSVEQFRIFSWEPFDGRYRPGLRTLSLASDHFSRFPLVQSWLEVEARGLQVHVPTGKHLVVSVSAPLDAGSSHAPLLVAASYGAEAPPFDDSRWPYQLTRTALSVGEVSPTFDDAQDLAFVALDARDHFQIEIKEGTHPRATLWAGAFQKSGDRGMRDNWNDAPIVAGGRFEGYETPQALKMLNGCLAPGSLDEACVERCVKAYPDSYWCWRVFAVLQSQSTPTQAVRSYAQFVKVAERLHPDHPALERAREFSHLVSDQEDLAQPAPGSPAKR